MSVSIIKSLTEIQNGGFQVAGGTTAFFKADRNSEGTITDVFTTYRGYLEGDTIIPYEDDTQDLGSPSAPTRHWNDLFIQNAPTVGSDRNSKKNISGSDLGLDFVNDLIPVSYQLRTKENGRYHYGLIAQDVSQSLYNIAKDTKYFGGFCSDIINSGSIDEEEAMSLRYTEFMAPMIKAIQELSTQNDELKNRIEQLESGSI